MNLETLTEATFTGYGRKQVTASNWTLTAESANTQTIKNAKTLVLMLSGGTNNTITHVFIATDETASLDVVTW